LGVLKLSRKFQNRQIFEKKNVDEPVSQSIQKMCDNFRTVKLKKGQINSAIRAGSSNQLNILVAETPKVGGE
jgi:hypothetical protein